MSLSTYEILCHAIRNKQQVYCDYDGHLRRMCPHVIGRKNFQIQVLSFQFAGSSSSGLLPDGEWRCMRVDRIRNAELRDGPWYTGERHSQPQTCVDLVEVEVDY